jgi:hypothetical protein
MAITLSPALEAARLEACRLPALQATLARLAATAPAHSTITLYDHADPDDVAANAIVAIPLTEAAGTIDEALFQLALDVPIEALIDGADAATGSTPLSARVTGPAGDWEFDLTVSATGDGGDIQLAPTGDDNGTPVVVLFNGATARITAATFQG